MTVTKESWSIEDRLILRRLIRSYTKYDRTGAAFLKMISIDDFDIVWDTKIRDDAKGVMGYWSLFHPFEVVIMAPYPVKYSKIQKQLEPVDIHKACHIIQIFPTWLHEINHVFQFVPHKTFYQMAREESIANSEDFKPSKLSYYFGWFLYLCRVICWALNSAISKPLYRLNAYTIEYDSRSNADEREEVVDFSNRFHNALQSYAYICSQSFSKKFVEEELEQRKEEALREFHSEYADLYDDVIDLYRVVEHFSNCK